MTLTTHSRSKYYNEYIIIQGFSCANHIITSFVRWLDGKIYSFDHITDLTKLLVRLDYWVASQGNKKLIVSVNKEFKKFLPSLVTNITYECFNSIIPVYSSWKPPIKFNFYNRLYKFKHEIIPQIERITDQLPVSALTDTDKYGHARTTATISRGLLNNWYPDVLRKLAITNKGRCPSYSWVIDYAANLMKFNANNIIQRETSKKILYNCNKWDVNSMFPYQALHQCTGGKAYQVDSKWLRDEAFKMDYITDDPYAVWCAIISFSKPEFHGVFDILSQSANCAYNTYEIMINSNIWRILVKDYNITVNDIEVHDYWHWDPQRFPIGIRHVLQDMHTKKAEAKSRGDEIMKRYYKLPTHTLHGYANGKWFTEQDNKAAYDGIWKSKYDDARKCYTSLDSIILYTGAAETLCNALRKFRADEVYNYDTDMITVPAGKDEIFEQLNKEVAKRYEEMGVNIEDVTHDGHTIGFWEKEAEYDCFYLLGPKMYFYVEKGDWRLRSTTAGYPTNLLALAIERKSGLLGREALEWFVEQDDVVLTEDDIGYCFNDITGYMEPAFFSKKVYLASK